MIFYSFHPVDLMAERLFHFAQKRVDDPNATTW